jgi:hypothetical protein
MVICLQIQTVLWMGGRTTCQLLNIHAISDVRQPNTNKWATDIEHSAFEDKMLIKKLKRHKLQVLIKFWQLISQEVKEYILRSINYLFYLE